MSETYEFHCRLNTDLDDWLEVLSPIMIISNITEDFKFLTGALALTSNGQVVMQRAMCLDEHIPYAIKTYSKERSWGDLPLKCIINEIECLRRLDSSQHFHSFHKVYEDEEGVYLVLDTYSGLSVADRLWKDGKYTEIQAAYIVKQLLEAAKEL
jgi:calcium-dependent protein kinase